MLDSSLTHPSHIGGCGNFDIILGRFAHIYRLHTTRHAAWGMLYLVPMLIGCGLVLEISNRTLQPI